MANSLRAKIKKLCHDGKITEADVKELIIKLDGHDTDLYNKAIDDMYNELSELLYHDFNITLDRLLEVKNQLIK